MSYGDIRINASVTRRIKTKEGYDEATLGLSQIPADSTDDDMQLALHAGLHMLDLIQHEIASRLRLPSVAPTTIPSLFVSQPNGDIERQPQDPPAAAKTEDPAPAAHPPKRREISPAEEVARVVVAGLDLAAPGSQSVSVETLVTASGEVIDHKAALAERVEAIKDASLTQTSIYVGDPEDLPSPVDPPAKEDPIPAASDVDLPTPFTNVLGIGIRVPPADDSRWGEPISERNRDGTGHGQLMAINAALTARGFKNGARHGAASAIINGIEFGDDRPRTPVSFESTRDLSVAQASIVLEWLDQAENVDIDRLLAETGAPTLGEEL